jgi:hypothetical protein
VPLYALCEHAFQLSAELIAKMAENAEERDQLRQHILENHVGRRTIEKITRLDEDMGDILDKEWRQRFRVEQAVREIVAKFIRSGINLRDILWLIDYGMRCRIAVARGQRVPTDLPPEDA